MQRTCSQRACLAVVTVSVICPFTGGLAQNTRERSNGLQITQRVLPSFVRLTLDDARGRPALLGVGFFILNNVVATSYARIKDVQNVTAIRAVEFGNNRSHVVKRIGAADPERDVALLQVVEPGRPLPFGDSSKVSVGESVFLATHDGPALGRLTQGSISGFQVVRGKCYLEVGAVPPALGGSAVLNRRGEVLGIIVKDPAPTAPHSFATPVSMFNMLRMRLMMHVGIDEGGIPGGAGPDVRLPKHRYIF